MGHTQEPWEVWTSNSHIRIGASGQDGIVARATIAADGMPVLIIRPDDANRIVACVNACEGASTKVLENGIKHDWGQLMTDLEAQRDQLLAALEGLVCEYEGYFEGAPESMPQIAARATIAAVKGDFALSAPQTPAVAVPKGWQQKAIAALQAVHDKFQSRPYGTGSYIPKDIRDMVRDVLAAASKSEGGSP